MNFIDKQHIPVCKQRIPARSPSFQGGAGCLPDFDAKFPARMGHNLLPGATENVIKRPRCSAAKRPSACFQGVLADKPSSVLGRRSTLLQSFPANKTTCRSLFHLEPPTQGRHYRDCLHPAEPIKCLIAASTSVDCDWQAPIESLTSVGATRRHREAVIGGS